MTTANTPENTAQAPGSPSSEPPQSAGPLEQFRSFGLVFWLTNIMEMFERLAYYGLRVVLPVYMILAVSEGGPEFSHIQKGVIYFWWATVQSGIPVFSGGFADKYGYKRTVGVSIIIKIFGYVVMGSAIPIAHFLTDGANVGLPGHESVNCVFMIGALLLALGTAVFKPGIQGILAYQMSEKNASMGWSIFYQLVNVGGFLGPILAGALKLLSWNYVFLVCAAIVSLNFVFFFFFEDPKVEGQEEEGAKLNLRKSFAICGLIASGIILSVAASIETFTGGLETLTAKVQILCLASLTLFFAPVLLTALKRSVPGLWSVEKNRGILKPFRLILAIAGLIGVILGLDRVFVTQSEFDWIGDAVSYYPAFLCVIILIFTTLSVVRLEEPEDHDEKSDGILGAFVLLWDSGLGILEPRLLGFLVIFSGFWAMFYQLFDLLPNYIEDWVDSRAIAAFMQAWSPFAAEEMPLAWHGHYPQELMINVNAGMCALIAFIVGYFTGKVRSMVAMIAGMSVASAAIYGLGLSMDGWFILLMIACFSMGELLSSPTKMRYFSALAPPGKKALYLGYINATSGIGWALGSIIAGTLYEEGGDKVNLAKRYLVEAKHMTTDAVAKLDKTDVIPKLGEFISKDREGVREFLFAEYDPSFVWAHFAMFGVMSMIGLILFDQITRRSLSWFTEAFCVLAVTFGVSGATYGWHVGVYFAVGMSLYMFYRKTANHLIPGGTS
jgi:dipeptide/tripeptide permease